MKINECIVFSNIVFFFIFEGRIFSVAFFILLKVKTFTLKQLKNVLNGIQKNLVFIQMSSFVKS